MKFGHRFVNFRRLDTPFPSNSNLSRKGPRSTVMHIKVSGGKNAVLACVHLGKVSIYEAPPSEPKIHASTQKKFPNSRKFFSKFTQTRFMRSRKKQGRFTHSRNRKINFHVHASLFNSHIHAIFFRFSRIHATKKAHSRIHANRLEAIYCITFAT